MEHDAFIKLLLERTAKIEDRLISIDTTLAKQEVHLQEHMRRSAANERAVELLSQQLSPIKKHVAMLEGSLKFVGILSLVLGVIGGVLKLLNIF
jgi:uncharacterized coiled-coil protein SlyX